MNADRLDELLRGALAEALPVATIIALDNVCRLAIAEVRRYENGGADVIPLHRKEAPAPVQRPGA